MIRCIRAHGLGSLAATLLSTLFASTVDAEAPRGHFVVKDEIVEDTATKLSWQRSAPDMSYAHAAAASYCTDLKLEGSGWRLPTIKELHTLVDETKTLPAIDDAAFPDAPAVFFWTSTILPTFAQYSWGVNFADGSDTWLARESAQRVRCVRRTPG
jgi:hypothetical protein